MSNRAIVIIALLVLTGVLLYLLAPMLTPFLMATLLAYIANPLVERLTKWHVPRGGAVALVFVLILSIVIGLLGFLIPLVQKQLAAFALKLPLYLDWMQSRLLPRVEQLLGQPIPTDFSDLRSMVAAHWGDVATFTRRALAGLTRSGFGLALTLVSIVLVPIVTFYLLLDWNKLRLNALALLPPEVRPTIARLARETDEVLGSFLRGQLLVMTALAILYSGGLLLLGLDLALPIGLVAGFLAFVPYLGFSVGIISALVAAYLQFQDPTMLVKVLIVFGVAQAIEGYYLTPKFVGERIGLHPVAVIFSIMAGGTLFGFLGVLLALPAAAALKVWLHYLHRSYIAPPPKVPRPSRRTRTATAAKAVP